GLLRPERERDLRNRVTSLVWLRDDLRLADNPALRAAVHRDAPVVVLFVLDEDSPGIRPLGGASRWWLHHSLTSLAQRLEDKGASGRRRRGGASAVVAGRAAEAGADAVCWTRGYGAGEREMGTALTQRLREDGIEVQSFGANLLFEPWTV